jgi:outer membrane scaffolding protein for murein synthesis (MipA/OmpV family)
VTDDEANAVVAPYEAEAGLNWHARLMVGYQLSSHWGLSLVAEYERINDEAAASPLVKERGVLGYFTGLVYRF